MTTTARFKIPKTDRERFLDRIPERPAELTECWIWRGAMGRNNGYPSFGMRGRTYSAHRVAYEWQVGPIPEGYDIDHLCHVRACVRPSHLDAVPARVNRGRQRVKRYVPMAKLWEDF